MIVIIPARGGSKGVAHKNLRPFANGPSLVRRAIAIAQGFGGSHIYVSTDDPLIAAEASQGAWVIDRPEELSQDSTPMLPVIQHAMAHLREKKWADGAETVAILQPTQPLRTAFHVLAARQLMARHECDSVVSVVKVPAHFSPGYTGAILGGQLQFSTHTRRQDIMPAYSRDGTIYLIKRSVIEADPGSLYGRTCIPLIIPSYESANIDTEEDWVRAEELVRRRGSL